MDTSPAAVIARLDAALARRGEDIVLQRLTLGPGNSQIPFAVTVRALVRGLDPVDLVEGEAQQRSRVVLSPSEIDRAGWPGPAAVAAGQAPAAADRRVPVDGDRAVIAGVARRIEAAVGIRMAGVLVRIELQVLG